MDARWLVRVFRLVDVIGAMLMAAPVTLGRDLLTGVAWTLAIPIAMRVFGAYAFPRKQSLARHLGHVGKALVAAAISAVLASLIFNPMDARSALPLLFASGFLVTLHASWWKIIEHARRQGLLTPNVFIVGATANAQRFIEAAMRTGEVNVLGLFDDRLRRAPVNILGVPLLGDTDALLNHRLAPYIDRVVIAITASAETRVRELSEKLGVLPHPLNLFVDGGTPDEDDATLARIAVGAEHSLSGWRDLRRRRIVAKRAMDLTLATLGLIAAGPVMLATALAVKLDSPGPVFFRQRRHGFNNEEFLVWKFRSMRHDAADAQAARQIRAGDDRVTRVGRFIRKTSLDELPQLFNVLRGEMSIVGPRPHAVGMRTAGVESSKLVAEYAHRHRMKPGLTGWAAIKGSRGPVDTPECVRRRVALDVEYIERQSFWLDLYIILMTVPCLLGDRSAVR
ncbi:exopolysaccharide biosynthesis polyprenyl glycosylphosphotransferase [Caulobacter sp. X]|uniref:polysaccharide biosynthesis protein HfsE n=1 Tax=Caulobacter sp. X TaxID=2048901 RepID=UPI00269BB15A|nr:exopolysaccharide biosynthesis polyprenyl glycosylphosphotransferase [Caulobacter sp. X]